MGMLFTCKETGTIVSLGPEKKESAAILNHCCLAALQRRREQNFSCAAKCHIGGIYVGDQILESPGAEQMM